MPFHHSPNNNIRILDGELSYFDSLDNFLLDYEGGYSGLPEGYREAQVEDGRSAIYTANKQEPMPEDLHGEIVLIVNSLASIIEAKALREGAEE